jgi:hypothetical protein
MVGGWVWDLANVRGGPSGFFCRPLAQPTRLPPGPKGLPEGAEREPANGNQHELKKTAMPASG